VPVESTRGEVFRLVLAAVREPGTSFPGGADDAEIADLQRTVGLPLPPELVEWLRVCKGDAIGPGGLYGVRHDSRAVDMASMLELFPGWQERGWLPVAGDGNGDYYVLITGGELAGHVAFIDQCDFDALDYIVASDLWTFLRSLLLADAGDRRWPFDRDHVLAVDPAMARVPADLQPWSGGA
jgi:cell wall assembly regulator SMI1